MHVYRWRQNNSYGRFNGPAHNLVVVARNVSDAREIVAHYWGGEMPFNSPGDCPCCGPRWRWEPEGYWDDWSDGEPDGYDGYEADSPVEDVNENYPTVGRNIMGKEGIPNFVVLKERRSIYDA